MAPERFTKPSSASCEIHEAALQGADLDLPTGGMDSSLPPRLTMQALMQRNRQLRQWFPSGLPTPEERWQAKCTAEFCL